LATIEEKQVMKRTLVFLAFLWLLLCGAANSDPASFTNDTVLDSDEALLWSRFTYNPRTYSAAGTFASALTIDSISSWRLPTLAEAQTLLDTTKDPKIYEAFDLGVSVSKWNTWTTDTFTKPHTSLSSRTYILSYASGRSSDVYTGSTFSFLVVQTFTGFDYGLFDSASAALLDSGGYYLLGAE